MITFSPKVREAMKKRAEAEALQDVKTETDEKVVKTETDEIVVNEEKDQDNG